MTGEGSSEALLRDAAAGSGTAWDQLVETFAPLAWAIARGHGLHATAAADVCHAAFLRFAEHLGSIDGDVDVWVASAVRQEAVALLRWAPDVGEHDPLDPALATMPARCRLLLRVLAVDPEPRRSAVAASLGLGMDALDAVEPGCAALAEGAG